MTEPFRPWTCPACGKLVKTYGPCPSCVPPSHDKGWKSERLLASHYEELRGNCASLEAFIETAQRDAVLDKQSLKRLDKSVTVMKVAFKIVKKVLRVHNAKLVTEGEEA